MQHAICLIPGDGVGREVIPATAEVLSALGLGLTFVTADAGFDCFRQRGNALPDSTLAAVAESTATLFGATSSPSVNVDGYHSPILSLRRLFDLYANLRPTVSLPGSFSRPGIDLLIVRENSEGLYAGRERREGDTAIAERVITVKGSERIARAAFEQARARATRRSGESVTARVTVAHKANILKVTDGLFRETCLKVAANYPDIQVDEMLVDTMALRLVRDPESFDVIVTTNLFGDILSDEAAALVGGLGVAPSANLGEHAAVFEPVHGSAPDIAGRGIANPIGAILAAAMMLDHLHEPEAAMSVRRAVNATLADGLRTPDIGGTATTRQVVNFTLSHLCNRL